MKVFTKYLIKLGVGLFYIIVTLGIIAFAIDGNYKETIPFIIFLLFIFVVRRQINLRNNLDEKIQKEMEKNNPEPNYIELKYKLSYPFFLLILAIFCSCAMIFAVIILPMSTIIFPGNTFFTDNPAYINELLKGNLFEKIIIVIFGIIFTILAVLFLLFEFSKLKKQISTKIIYENGRITEYCRNDVIATGLLTNVDMENTFRRYTYATSTTTRHKRLTYSLAPTITFNDGQHIKYAESMKNIEKLGAILMKKKMFDVIVETKDGTYINKKFPVENIIKSVYHQGV